MIRQGDIIKVNDTVYVSAEYVARMLDKAIIDIAKEGKVTRDHYVTVRALVKYLSEVSDWFREVQRAIFKSD